MSQDARRGSAGGDGASQEGEAATDTAVAASVERDGVAVRKGVDPDSYGVPVVKYAIRSTRDDEVTVTLIDAVPDDVAPEEVGFHDEFRGDDWTVRDSKTIAFECEVPAGDVVTTLYGVRQPSAGLDQFGTQPVLRIATDDERGDQTADESGSERGDRSASTSDDAAALDLDDPYEELEEDLAFDEADAASTTGDASAAGADGAAEPTDDATFSFSESDGVDAPRESAGSDADAAQPTDGSRRNGASRRDGERRRDRTATDTESNAGVASALIEELENDELDEEERQVLRAELALRVPESTNAFVDHVQTRLRERQERLEADIESLEQSINELYGLAADARDVEELVEVVQRLEADAADDDRLDALEAAVDELREEAATVERLRAIETDLDDLRREAATESEIDALREDVTADLDLDALGDEVATDADLDRIWSELDAVVDETADRAAVADLRDRLDALDERLASLRERVDETAADLESAIDGKADREAVEQVEATTSELDERIESTAATLDERIDAIAADLDELAGDDEALSELEAGLAELRRQKVDRTSMEAKLSELRNEKVDRNEFEMLRGKAAETGDVEELREEIERLRAERSHDDRFDELREDVQRLDSITERKADQSAIQQLENRLADFERRLDEQEAAAAEIEGGITGQLARDRPTIAALATALGAWALSGVLAFQEPYAAIVAFCAGVVALALWMW